jgi:hypothetical protein
MTIGIAMTLEDGVLLVADGRRTRPQAKTINTPPKDNVNKIHTISENVAAISFGVKQATDEALRLFRATLPNTSTLDDVRVHLERSVDAAWHDLMSSLAPEVNRNHPTMRAALLVAGLFANQPFMVATLYHPNGHVSPVMRTDKFSLIVLGGEEQESQQFFTTLATDAVQRFSASPGTGTVNLLITALLASAQKTIRFVQQNDPDVGGIIHYVVIRRNCPYTAGQL